MSRIIAACLVLLPVLPMAALAQTQPAPPGTPASVHVGPGQQSDPHVSGDIVAYTSLVEGASEIRYHDLSTGDDRAIPNEGSFDFLSDVSGTTVVFTRVTPESDAIYRFDVSTHGPAIELSPQQSSRRRAAAIGGTTVAWQDFGFGGPSEIVAVDLITHNVVRVTEDGLTDRAVAVAPQGNVLAWVKCQTETTGCDVWQARYLSGHWSASAVTGAEGEESLPDTNGLLVVYASARTFNGVLERDIYWKNVSGGPEQRLSLPGIDANPNIAGNLIAFERRDPATPANTDIVVYDVSTETLYQVTQTPQNESLNDIAVTDEGLVRVVWTRSDDGDQNVYAFSFALQDGTSCEIEEESTCDNPGSRPLLGTLEVTRGKGKPKEEAIAFSGPSGSGLLCVVSDCASSGTIALNDVEVVRPGDFNPHMKQLSRTVELSADNLLSAKISGRKGSSFEVKVYGPLPTCVRSSTGGGGGSPNQNHYDLGDLETGEAFGCNAGGTSGLALVLALIALAWMIEVRRVRVPVRRSRRTRRER